MPMIEDMSAFLNSDEHGTIATYKTTEIVGIFENQYVEIGGVQSVKPTFLIDDASAPNIARGNTITIDGIVYKFILSQPDGTGMTLLVLEATN